MKSSIARSLVAAAAAAALTVTAVPLEDRQLGPTVKVANGNVVGRSVLGVDSFIGIPFAKPPVGQLRLKPPQPYEGQYPGGTFQATASTAKSCPQGIVNLDTSFLPRNTSNLIAGFVDTISGQSEDCLTLNVQRPAGTSADAKLPVIFWIYGGGFAAGSTSMYDGSGLVTTGTVGAAKGYPFIYVAVNYRLSAFGFMGGKELQKDGSTNLGLRDQRLGLQWVADNIAAFGGDPTKVTIWGESAGSISVNDHTLINNGDHTYKGKPLFRAAVMNSGTVVPAEPVDNVKPQQVYDTVVAAAGCSNSPDTLACLRSVPYETFKSASNSLPSIFSYRAVDLAYVPRPDPTSDFFPSSPELAVRAGKFARVPIIAGDQEDEGTLFSLTQSNITTNDQLIKYFQSYFPTRGADVIPGLVATYPESPSAGSPFRTGPFYNVYPQFKRLAAILGDVTFTLIRRAYLAEVAEQVPSWSYLDTHLYGTPVLGTLHGNDILSIFYGLAPPNVVNTYRTAVISFAYFQDPNKIKDLKWPRYRAAANGRKLLNIDVLFNRVMADDFRSASYDYLAATYGEIAV